MNKSNASGSTGKTAHIGAVIFFTIGILCFFCGLFYWIQKRQELHGSSTATHILATPEVLEKGLQTTLKDKVDYSFWPLYYIPPTERQAELKKCLLVAQKYLTATDEVSRAAHIWDSMHMLPLMVRHYALHPRETMLSKPKGPKKLTMLTVDGKPCIQLLLGMEASPDMEFCFFKDDTEKTWKLDWQQFARYQTGDWEQFASGQGEEMGEFRLWIYRDKISETKDDYAFRMIAPGRNGTDERSVARPITLVPKKSDIGKRLYMLFRINEEMAYSQHRVLNANDEKGALRVRLLLSRTKTTDKKSENVFTIVKLIGEGWYATAPLE